MSTEHSAAVEESELAADKLQFEELFFANNVESWVVVCLSLQQHSSQDAQASAKHLSS